MSKKGTGKFWIGKGTLGNIRHGEEIMEGDITEERMEEFIEQGLIGEKLKKVKFVRKETGEKIPDTAKKNKGKGKGKK